MEGSPSGQRASSPSLRLPSRLDAQAASVTSVASDPDPGDDIHLDPIPGVSGRAQSARKKKDVYTPRGTRVTAAKWLWNSPPTGTSSGARSDGGARGRGSPALPQLRGEASNGELGAPYRPELSKASSSARSHRSKAASPPARSNSMIVVRDAPPHAPVVYDTRIVSRRRGSHKGIINASQTPSLEAQLSKTARVLSVAESALAEEKRRVLLAQRSESQALAAAALSHADAERLRRKLADRQGPSGGDAERERAKIEAQLARRLEQDRNRLEDQVVAERARQAEELREKRALEMKLAELERELSETAEGRLAAKMAEQRAGRVDELFKRSVKRMAHAGILRGWDSWREQWEEGVRTRQMLKQAGGRLLRPKLAASMALWRYSWEQGSAARAAQSYQEQLQEATQFIASLKSQLHELAEMKANADAELARQQEAAEAAEAGRMTAMQQAAIRADRERGLRIEQLTKKAGARLKNQGIMRGFTAWQFKWEERVAQKQMLASAGARLLKPKLAASFAGWKTDYFTELTAAQSDLAASFPALKKKFTEQAETLDMLRTSLATAERGRAEAEKNLQKLMAAGSEAERLKVMREAEAKEKRIEELRYKAMKRIKNQGIMRGWSAWQELWEERVTERQMLAAAGGRLLKPKLAASLAHWRHDWETTAGIQGESDAESRLAVEREANAALEEEVQRLKEEAAEAAAAAAADKAFALERLRLELGGTAEEREKAARIEYLTKKAGARIKNQGIMRGWTAWSDLFEGEKAQRQMLASAGARLMRPKLAASLAHWRGDYEATVVARRALGAAGVLEVAKERIAQLEADIANLEEQTALRLAAAARHEADALDRQRRELSGLEAERAKAGKEREMEARIEYLYQKAGARIKNQGIIRGWSAWQEMWEWRSAERRMLASAGARLMRPKLAASMAKWRESYLYGEVEEEKKKLKEKKAMKAEALHSQHAEIAGLKMERQTMIDRAARQEKQMAEMRAKVAAAEADRDAKAAENRARLKELEKSQAGRIDFEKRARDVLETEVKQLRLDLQNAKKAAEAASLSAAEKEAKAREDTADEYEKRMAARAAASKGRQIEHLHAKAVKRMMNQGLMRGWSAWQAKYEERVAQKQLLLAAASRLSKPLLTASLAHWRMDYEATLVSAGQRDLKRQMRALQKEAAEALKQERHSAFVTRQALHARIKELEEQIRNLFGAQVVEPAAPPPPPDPVMIVFHSISAKGIPNADAGGGSDPYARFTIIDDFTANKPGKNQIGYTSYIQNELDPNWAGERLQLDLTPGGDRPIRLRVEVWDKDVKTADDLIASAELTLSEIESGVSGKRTIRLEGDDGPIPHFNFGWSVLAEKEERQKTKIGAFSTVTGIGARKPGRTGPQGQAPPNVKVSPQKGKFRAYG